MTDDTLLLIQADARGVAELTINRVCVGSEAKAGFEAFVAKRPAPWAQE